jgi:hypothetical protein
MASKLSKLKNNECKDLCEFVMQTLSAKMNLYFLEEALFRRELAMILQAKGEVSQAATILAGVNYGELD